MSTHRHIEAALRAVLPPATTISVEPVAKDVAIVHVQERTLRARWLHNAWLNAVRGAIEDPEGLDIIVSHNVPASTRALLAQRSVGWVDTAGSAEIVTGFLVIARTGHTRRPPPKNAWTSATIGVCEALLTGVRPTVSATSAATGYAKGTCTKALRHLNDLGLLTAGARRGRKAGRAVADPAHLLETYVLEAHRAQPALRMSVSALWRDPLAGVIRAGQTWENAGTAWAATGLVAAAAVAPLVTSVGTAEVYVDADSVAELENLARAVDLRPIEGGRLVLAPFPTRPAKRLTTIENGLRVVPWPRLVADLRRSGVRGEDAAEHVREKMQRA